MGSLLEAWLVPIFPFMIYQDAVVGLRMVYSYSRNVTTRRSEYSSDYQEYYRFVYIHILISGNWSTISQAGKYLGHVLVSGLEIGHL